MRCQSGMGRLAGSKDFWELHGVWFGRRRLVLLQLTESICALSQAHNVSIPLVLLKWNVSWVFEIVALLSQCFILVHNNIVIIADYGIAKYFLIFVTWFFEKAAANLGIYHKFARAWLLATFEVPRTSCHLSKWIIVIFALMNPPSCSNRGFSFWDTYIFNVGWPRLFYMWSPILLGAGKIW